VASLSSSVVYLASDLNRKRREFLDEARTGMARLRDTDGTSLVMVPESRLAALSELVVWAQRHLQVEAVARRAAVDRSPTDFGDLAWLSVLDDADLATFLTELEAGLFHAMSTQVTADLEHLVQEWRCTAEALSDPVRRAVLLGTHDDDDFAEVGRPE
jgi:hypothetical protein